VQQLPGFRQADPPQKSLFDEWSSFLQSDMEMP